MMTMLMIAMMMFLVMIEGLSVGSRLQVNTTHLSDDIDCDDGDGDDDV